MLGKKFTKTFSIIIASAMLFGIISSTSVSAAEKLGSEPSLKYSVSAVPAVSYSEERLKHNYTNVSSTYKFSPYTGEPVVYSVAALADAYRGTYLAAENYDYSGEAFCVQAGDEFGFEVDVNADGLYYVGFDYLSYDESILPIEFSMMVDGEFPFYEMRNLKFETTWVSNVEKNLDRYGNEMVVMPEKLIRWEHKDVSDAGYRYSRPLAIQLSKGKHEIKLHVEEGKFLIGNMSLSAPETIPEYNGADKAEGNALIPIEGEAFYLRNDSAIHAAGDYDTSLFPVYVKETILNTIDEASYSKPGQTITYKFTAEKAGNYYIGLHYIQSGKNGFPVFVNYMVDGKIPNTQFLNYPMAYTTKYKTTTLSDDDGNKLSVYLEPGEHTISMTISADPIRYALESVDEIISGISDLSLEVTKVAGTNKDKYRDLKITRYIPDIEDRLNGWVTELYSLADRATEFVDAKDAEKVAAFSYLLIAAKQLETLAEEPNELIYRVDELSTSTNSINTQIANFVDIINDNSIAVDRIYIYQEGAKLPGKPGFFASLWLKIKRFYNSFHGQSYSASNLDEEHIQVWVNRPRQYVEIMQKMIDEQFTPQTGIDVDLAIMTDAQKLILSNASDDTPDIATGINYSIPFELGIRGALVDLSKFDNYKEVFGRYSDGMLVPSVIGDGLYSLPETMNFYVLFYRTDILGKLGLEIPETMDELIAILPDLQMRGLNVYYPTAVMLTMRNFHGTTPLIFQNGGRLYGETARDLMLDSEAAVEGFTELTELFTLYNLPVDVPNFYQHFRNGDLAVGIADFNSYNLILNAAPEIANSWAIAPVPGVKDETTGEIYRYMSGGAESTVMFSSNDEREQKAWTFMDWWSSTEVQAEFGQRIQIMYGDEYIWPTANLEAFSRLPYPTSDKNIILEQAECILEAPRLLGSYMLEREMSNAFNDIVVNGDTVRARIDEAVKIVKRETDRKLEEFGYIDSDGNNLMEYYIPSVDRVRSILNR